MPTIPPLSSPVLAVITSGAEATSGVLPIGTTIIAADSAPALPNGSESGANPLSEEFQRQIRHISYEFMRLKQEHFGPSSQETGAHEQELVVNALTTFFIEAVESHNVNEGPLIQAARSAESTLREIRTLRGTKHFFSATLDAFYGALAMLGADYDYFAPALLWELHKYTKKRDEEESRFLQPFHDYSRQLDDIVKGQLNGHSFSYFEMEARIKRALLTKLQIRNWSDMKEFYDLLGLRLVVDNQHEALAAVALVEGALRVHEAEALLNPDVPYYFRVDHIEEKISVDHIDSEIHRDATTGYHRTSYNDRGYRGIHVNIVRVNRLKGKDYATAEIQVMSRGIKEWGEIQRLLVYKEENRIPKDVKDIISDYCRRAADYIVACENGEIRARRENNKVVLFLRDDPATTVTLPDIDILALNRIEDEALMNDVLDRICDMDTLMGHYPRDPLNATS